MGLYRHLIRHDSSDLARFTGMHYLYNFNVLQAGNGVGNEFLKRSEVGLDELTRQMAGGDELTELSHALQR
jgi:hypothetical protein